MKYWLPTVHAVSREYMRTTYAPGHDLYKVSSVPEDWDGLVDLLQQRPMNPQ